MQLDAGLIHGLGIGEVWMAATMFDCYGPAVATVVVIAVRRVADTDQLINRAVDADRKRGAELLRLGFVDGVDRVTVNVVLRYLRQVISAADAIVSGRDLVYQVDNGWFLDRHLPLW